MMWILGAAALSAAVSGYAYWLSSQSQKQQLQSFPLWQTPLVTWGDLLLDLRDWWLYSCRDCKQRFASSGDLTSHIIHRTGCTVPPAI